MSLEFSFLAVEHDHAGGNYKITYCGSYEPYVRCNHHEESGGLATLSCECMADRREVIEGSPCDATC